MFCKLKNWRRVATRYDRLARSYLSGLASPPLSERERPLAPNSRLSLTTPSSLIVKSAGCNTSDLRNDTARSTFGGSGANTNAGHPIVEP
jgi:hypothetical protein